MTAMRIIRLVFHFAFFALLVGCNDKTPVMLGTLEWDRITIPSTAAEPIVKIVVREGDSVAKGQLLIQLDTAHAKARLENAQSEVDFSQQALSEAMTGPRSENIREAKSNLESLRADADYARAQMTRIKQLFAERYVSHTDLDRATAGYKAAEAQVRAAQANLDLLQNGTRSEQLAQAQARLTAAKAQLENAQIDIRRLTVTSPRDGRIDSLPYRQGDQPAAGSPLAVLLVGVTPIARIYVPAPMRTSIRPDLAVSVRIEGTKQLFDGTVRSVRSEPSFTPYYALNGEDAARLSYLAEVSLGKDAVDLPSGIPVSVIIKAK